MTRFTLAVCSLLVPLAVACAQGTPDSVIDDRGGNTPTGTGGAAGTGGASASGGGGASTGSSGNAPTTCPEANGFVGCCQGDTAYFCKSGATTVTAHACSATQVCGWNATKGYYYCVAPPGGADPSGVNPIACQ